MDIFQLEGSHEKISIRFRSNVSWCGIDVCVDAWELSADDKKEMHCEEFEVTGVMSGLVNYCKVKDLTCVLYSGRGVSCVRGSIF